VGDPAGEAANGLELLGLAKLVLERRFLGLGLLARGDECGGLKVRVVPRQ